MFRLYLREGLCCRQISFDLVLIGVVVGMRRVNLSDHQVSDPLRDVLGVETKLLLDHDAPSHDTTAGHERAAAANFGERTIRVPIAADVLMIAAYGLVNWAKSSIHGIPGSTKWLSARS